MSGQASLRLWTVPKHCRSTVSSFEPHDTPSFPTFADNPRWPPQHSSSSRRTTYMCCFMCITSRISQHRRTSSSALSLLARLFTMR